MIAVKGNRTYTITDSDKQFYKKQGFDILGDDGEILEHGDGKTVTYERYAELEKENEALKKEIKALKKTEKPKE